MGWLVFDQSSAQLHPWEVNLAKSQSNQRDVLGPESWRFQLISEQPKDLPISKLPFKSRSEIQQPKSELWIVIDNIVYDCTEFALHHPGGASVIENFRGQDCSWQFWRFHDSIHLDYFGPVLRIATTEGVQNRFCEMPRFVGAKKLFMASDDD
jgi:cytochrome b involved in lipid metabolism